MPPCVGNINDSYVGGQDPRSTLRQSQRGHRQKSLVSLVVISHATDVTVRSSGNHQEFSQLQAASAPDASAPCPGAGL